MNLASLARKVIDIDIHLESPPREYVHHLSQFLLLNLLNGQQTLLHPLGLSYQFDLPQYASQQVLNPLSLCFINITINWHINAKIQLIPFWNPGINSCLTSSYFLDQIITHRYNIIHMQAKQQLVQELLKRQPQRKCKNKLKNPEAFNYERNKQELIQQLLGFSSHEEKIHVQTQKFSKLSIYYRPKEEIKNQILEKDRIKSSVKETFVAGAKQQVYYNEYFIKNSNKHKQVRIVHENESTPEIINEQICSDPNLDNSCQLTLNLLDLFTKKDNFTERSNYCKIAEESQNECKRSENKSFQNQSTLAVSKLAKSPHRAIRKTQIKVDFKSNLSDQTKKQKSPHKLTISRVSAIQIRVEAQTQIKPQQDSKAKNGSSSKQNLSYSSSVIHLTGNQFDLPSDLKPKTPKSNLLESFQVSESKASPYILPKSPQVEKIIKKYSAQKKPEITIGVIKQDSSLQIQTKNFEEKQSDNQEYQYQEKLFANSGYRYKNRDYQQSTPPIDFRKISKIQDQFKFKREIQEQKQRKKDKQLAQSLRHRQKTDKIKIFTGCQALFYEQKQKKQAKQQSQELQQNKKSSQLDVSQSQAENSLKQQKFSFFDFLKGKITDLSKNNQNLTEPKKEVFPTQKPERQANKLQQAKNHKKNQAQEDSSLKVQLSEASSSNSFFKQKQLIEEKGVLNVDLRDIVDESVKKVSLNLEKLEENMRNSHIQSKMMERSQQSKHNQPSKKSSSHQMQLSKQQIIESGMKEKTQNQSSAFKKIFGVDSGLKQNLNKQQQVIANHQQQKEISDFFSSQNVKNDRQANLSQPSTVQKNEQRSVEKSDFLNQLNFQEIKDEIGLNLFQKLQQPKKESTKKQESFQKVLNQLHSQIKISKQQLKLQQSSQKFQNSIKETANKGKSKEHQININLMNLKQVSISCDALSFSKLQSFTERQHSIDPTLNSFKITSNLKQIQKQPEPKQNPITLKQETAQKQMNSSGKKGKVQRIQINIDDSQQSGDEEQKIKKEISDSEIDIDDIQDYQSDSDEQKNNQGQKRSGQNQRQKLKLTPIIEQDLQQSQLNKNQYLNKKLQQPSFHLSQQAKIEEVKELEKQLLKDFKMTKVRSSYNNICADEDLDKQQLKPKPTKIIRTITKKVSLIKNLSQPEQSSISYQSISSSKEVSKTQKELIESMKGGIEGLKQKISSAVHSEVSKYDRKISQNSQLHSEAKHISIDLDDQFQNFTKKNSQSQSNTLAKIMKDNSSSLRVEESSANFEKPSKKNINFQEIDVADEQNLYKQFKETFLSLKKKVEEDHKYY